MKRKYIVFGYIGNNLFEEIIKVNCLKQDLKQNIRNAVYNKFKDVNLEITINKAIELKQEDYPSDAFPSQTDGMKL